MRVHQLQIGLALVGLRAGEALVRDACEAVDVRARIDQRAPLDLLGRGVVDGADEIAGRRQAPVRLRALREAEVGQEDVVAGGDQDVAGLDVAMHEPAHVCRIECARGLADDPRGAGRIEAPLTLQQGVEVRRLDEPHRDVELSARLAGVEDGNDVRVLDARGDAPLALEPLPESGILHQLERQQLERVAAPQPQVLGAVDAAHAAAPDAGLDPVTRDGAADQRIGCHRSFVPLRPAGGSRCFGAGGARYPRAGRQVAATDDAPASRS